MVTSVRHSGGRSLAVVGLLVTALVALAAGLSQGRSGSDHHDSRSRSIAQATHASTVGLREPTALALSHDGELFVLDPTRDQILKRLRDGRFAVVAGIGRRGFSGDGLPAVRAKLNLNDNSDLVVSPRGTVYFTDSGNGRVRTVLPSGVIRTVAGDGHPVSRSRPVPFLTGTRPARRSTLVDPGGLAFGPDGRLYISAQDVVRLAPHGTLSYFAGITNPHETGPASLFDGIPGRIAFDRSGDLFVSVFPSLFERISAGRMRLLGNGFRSDGADGIVASSPAGSVFLGYGDTGGIIDRLTDPDAVHTGDLMSRHAVIREINPSALQRALGGREGVPNGFGPSGLAISSNGTIYTDTDKGYFSAIGALIQITPKHQVHVLWKS